MPPAPSTHVCVDAECDVLPTHGAEGVLLHCQVSGHQGEEVAGLHKRILPHSEVPEWGEEKGERGGIVGLRSIESQQGKKEPVAQGNSAGVPLNHTLHIISAPMPLGPTLPKPSGHLPPSRSPWSTRFPFDSRTGYLALSASMRLVYLVMDQGSECAA